MRRKIIYAFGSLLIAISSFSQGGIVPKAYAYSRETLSGIRPSIIADENGGTSTRTHKPSLQYFIYIETVAGLNLEIKSVWVNGRQFSIIKEKIITPVIIQNGTMPDKTKDTLVVHTKNIVWQLNLKNEMKEDRKSGILKQLLDKNEVVIVYTRKGKINMLSIKRIKKLSPISLA